MRFEIRTGGALAFLIGLGLLSGSVFLLGLVAGYEMGRQQEGNHQFASVYPLPPAAASSPAAGAGTGIEATPVPAAVAPVAESPPLAEAAPTPEVAPPLAEAAPTPEVPPPPEAAPPPAVAVAPAPVAPAPMAPPPMAAAPMTTPPAITAPVAPAPVATAPVASAAIASAPVVPARPPIARSSTMEGSATHGEPEISSPVSQRHRGGYSIQIEAVMDKSGADGMVAKLRHLGYEAYLVETLIGGETWYRVRVGPFPTEAAAQSAEQKLHAQYSGSLGTP